MKAKKTILITAYAVNPFKGSEDGTGWNISKELAKTNELHIVTRKNNRAEIERYFKEFESPIHKNMNFHYYDLPGWIMNWKHRLGERGYVIYFYLWQFFLPFYVRSKKIKFDLAHAVNFHSDSHPQFLWFLGKPVFWGPIGHHPPVPKNYINPIYGERKWAKDRLYNIVKFMMRRLDPFYYFSKWSAKKIFVINSGVNKSVGANPDKIIVLPAVAHNETVKMSKPIEKENFTVLSVGRFVYMKGFDVTIRAFANFYHSLPDFNKKTVKLKLVGKGEELNLMKTIIEKEKITEAVEIVKWVKKEEMESIYKQASVFCFGSHEGAGMVVPEALSYGLPIVCFDNYGPGELCNDSCSIRIPYGNYCQSINGFSKALSKLYYDKASYQRYALNASTFASDNFNWSRKAKIILGAYATAV